MDVCLVGLWRWSIAMTEESPVQPRGRDPIPRDDLKALVEEFRDQAEKTSDESRGPIHGSAYGNGVSAGLEYAADELEALLDT